MPVRVTTPRAPGHRLTRLLAAGVAAAALALVTACSPVGGTGGAGASASTHTVDTVYGKVKVPASVKRVAAASYDTPWQLQSLGIKPVAVQDYKAWIDSYTPAQQAFVKGVPTIGTYGEINYEAIAATTPDLIIGDAGEVDQAAYKRLRAIAPTVIVGGDSRGDWQSITEQTADAVGKHDVWASSKKTFEQTRDRLKEKYAKVIADNRWIHFSLGNDASQFSVQQPTGSTGNLVVNELGLKYGPGVPTDYDKKAGYGSYPLEQLGPIFQGVTVALTFENVDGTPNPAIQAIMDNELFTRLDVAKAGHVFKLSTGVTDYVTATAWLNEVEKKVLSVL